MEKWFIKNKKADFNKLMSKWGISEVIARCLVNKGFEKPEDIEGYLYPHLNKLHNPLLMKDVDKACSILEDKVKCGKKIRIIGDYDVDGVVSTYILYRTLLMMKADVDYRVPDRIKNGYGISISMVDNAYKEGIDTILTCDNGIAAIEQVKMAKDYGMTVIITDHHSLTQLGNEIILPEADAIINPKQPDCLYPFKDLCGAAIAYKLIQAFMKQLNISGFREYNKELISYVCIATVCDVMDLMDENRIIVKCGLKFLKKTKNKGLLALMDITGIDKDQLNAYHLGYVIGPSLNASGRLDTAEKGLDLFLADTKEDAISIAKELRTLNEMRKGMTASNVDKAVHLIEGSTLCKDKVLVVYLEDCHESIAGIIAGRIKERYNKPTIILTPSKEGVKGSARSIEQYNIIEELLKYRNLLDKVGGHPMAAGLSISPDNIDSLRGALNNNLRLTDEMIIPKVTIDILLPFGYINESLIEELKLLEPFGKGNEKPLFAEKDLRILSAYTIGKNSCGIKFHMINQYGCKREAIYFGDVKAFFAYIKDKYGFEEEEKLRTGRRPDFMIAITYYPRINKYKGMKNIQLMMQNYK